MANDLKTGERGMVYRTRECDVFRNEKNDAGQDQVADQLSLVANEQIAHTSITASICMSGAKSTGRYREGKETLGHL